MIGAAKAAPFLRQDLFTFICRFQRHFLAGQKKEAEASFNFFISFAYGTKLNTQLPGITPTRGLVYPAPLKVKVT